MAVSFMVGGNQSVRVKTSDLEPFTGTYKLSHDTGGQARHIHTSMSDRLYDTEKVLLIAWQKASQAMTGG